MWMDSYNSGIKEINRINIEIGNFKIQGDNYFYQVESLE